MHLFPVSGGLVQSLQPHVTQSQHGVGVVLRGRLLQNTLKLLLTWSPFLLSQVKISYQGPGIWVILHQTEQTSNNVHVCFTLECIFRTQAVSKYNT